MSTSTRGNIPENLSPEYTDAISTHKGHDLVVDNGASFEDEQCVWCETCSVTVWYLESDCAAE